MEIRNNLAMGTTSFGMALKRPTEHQVLRLIEYGKDHGFSFSRVEKALLALKEKQAGNKHFDISINSCCVDSFYAGMEFNIVPKSEMAKDIYSMFHECGCDSKAILPETYKKLFGREHMSKHPIKKAIAAIVSVPKVIKTKIKEMTSPIPLKLQHEANEATRLEAIVDKIIATNKKLGAKSGSEPVIEL
ncbi:MAG: hypothetical protein ACI37Q_00860 [Candidatus Gastranaerophilaceae bacterium]